MRNVRIGVDIGGTFTDFVVEADGERITFKLLTTSDRPQDAVLAGIDRTISEFGVTPGDITALVHGTTLATNAVIERRGAKVGFVTTRGFRDTLEMGYEYRYDQYDLLIDRTPPLVERRLRFVVPERIAAGGAIMTPLDRDAMRDAARALAAEAVESIAVGFLHSFSNPEHELIAEAILQEELPGIPISLSSDVSPEIREYDRFSTVVVNAYIRPLMRSYLAAMETGLRARGVAAPILLIQSHGGICDVAAASRYPVRLLESGPAGGAIFAAAIASELNLSRALLLDVGGTTAKLCFIDDFKPHTARAMEVGRVDRYRAGSGIPLRFPVIELSEIGAGGGSIAKVDTLGRLQVGPRSAGSAPGPICYQRGGTEPTVTDGNLLLGRLDPDRFADGTIALDPVPAAAMLTEKIAAPLGLTLDEACCGILAVMHENMANAAREHALDADKSLTNRALIAIGGGSGLHAADLAKALGIDVVVIPRDAGVGSAAGFLRAPFAFERTLSRYQSLSGFDQPAVLLSIDALIAQTVEEAMATGHVAREAIATSLTAQMRYRGQGSELTVAIPYRSLTTTDAALHLGATFARAYGSLYGRTLPGNDVEILGWTVRIEATVAGVKPPAATITHAAPAARHRRLVDPLTGASWDAVVRQRAELVAGAAMRGPALIVDAGTMIVVPAHWTARVTAGEHITMTRDRAAADGEIAA